MAMLLTGVRNPLCDKLKHTRTHTSECSTEMQVSNPAGGTIANVRS